MPRLVGDIDARHPSAVAGIQAHYDAGVTDEFVEPFQIGGVDGCPASEGDVSVVVFQTSETDRCREITRRC